MRRVQLAPRRSRPRARPSETASIRATKAGRPGCRPHTSRLSRTPARRRPSARPAVPPTSVRRPIAIAKLARLVCAFQGVDPSYARAGVQTGLSGSAAPPRGGAPSRRLMRRLESLLARLSTAPGFGSHGAHSSLESLVGDRHRPKVTADVDTWVRDKRATIGSSSAAVLSGPPAVQTQSQPSRKPKARGHGAMYHI